MTILVSVGSSTLFGNGQKQPDAKRVKEIQTALLLHNIGNHPVNGNWDESTKDLLRNIARDHGWQTNHVPDARVLILLDLGNAHSDPDVLMWQKNHLDPPYKGDDDAAQ